MTPDSLAVRAWWDAAWLPWAAVGVCALIGIVLVWAEHKRGGE